MSEGTSQKKELIEQKKNEERIKVSKLKLTPHHKMSIEFTWIEKHINLEQPLLLDYY